MPMLRLSTLPSRERTTETREAAGSDIERIYRKSTRRRRRGCSRQRTTVHALPFAHTHASDRSAPELVKQERTASCPSKAALAEGITSNVTRSPSSSFFEQPSQPASLFLSRRGTCCAGAGLVEEAERSVDNSFRCSFSTRLTCFAAIPEEGLDVKREHSVLGANVRFLLDARRYEVGKALL